MPRPLPLEYPEFFGLYINLVPEGDVISILGEQSKTLQHMLSQISEEQSEKSYAFGKWTLKEVLGHLMDNERLFVARALRIARGDKQNLPGYDQDEYVKNARCFKRTLKDMLEEMLMLRAANILLFKSFDEEDLQRRGFVNDYEITVNALMYVLAGHEAHHLNYIKENYLGE